MPVPSSIADLSSTPSSNSPAGSETPSSIDDYLRTSFAFIKQTYDATQSGSSTWCGNSGGTANAITLTSSPAITAYGAGQVFRFKAATTNTGATTVAVSGLAAISVQVNGASCIGGEIVSGQWYEVLLSSASIAQLRTSLAPNLTTAINGKRAIVAATATTTPLWIPSNGNIQDWTGTPTITDFPAAPQPGATREVYPAAGTVITNAGNISVQGSANYTVASGDKLTITAVTETTCYVSITRKDGQALTANSGARNRLINGNLVINQLVVSGSVVLAAGAYGHDGWKAGAAGCTYTFAASGSDVVITISAGSLLQIVEDKNIEGGIYALSNEGTALARIAINGASTSGAYATASKASPLLSAPSTANQSVTVEFTTGTINRAQLEAGSSASPFERLSFDDILRHCQRYYEKSYDLTVAPGSISSPGSLQIYTPSGNTGTVALQVIFKVNKYAMPTVTSFSPATGASGVVRETADRAAAIEFVGTTGASIRNNTVGNAGLYYAHWTASARL